VTLYPDVADLFLAADALVTDYSSVMFDFALTGRPIMLLVPDLVQYRDATRGFYFDLEAEPPGPLLQTSEQVIDLLKRGLPDTHAEQRAHYISKFAPWDDGHAADRVVDAVFGEKGTRP
jgi:CDP-glycerol glycerophosphotransferase